MDGADGQHHGHLMDNKLMFMTMEKLIPNHGGYRTLKTFQLARMIFDITVRFCDKFVGKKSRTHDQMVQAARSGVQNIAEGSEASGTSKKTELKLTNVARASLVELLLDYEDFLRQHNLPIWEYDDRRRRALVKLRVSSADQYALWVKTIEEQKQGTIEEIAANGMLALITVTCQMLDRQIAAQATAFQLEGGFTERLFHMRKDARNNRP
jgi:four helix bundle suffix protein